MQDAVEIYPRDMESVAATSYDLFVATVGYETRARYLAQRAGSRAVRRIAAAFTEQQVLAYQANLEFYKDAGFQVTEVRDSEFQNWSRQLVRETLEGCADDCHVAIDVSSLSRFRTACLVDSFRRAASSFYLTVDFLYSGAEFSAPPIEEAPNSHVGPVLPAFAGWSTDPNRPPVVLLGLGYEQDKAIGAVERIQPAETWAFFPQSTDKRYGSAVKEANQSLLETIPRSHQFFYDLLRPFDCFVELESLAFRSSAEAGTVLLPFGPKIFATCCLLVAAVHKNVAVWRVSPGEQDEPFDRIPNGETCAIRMVRSPNARPLGETPPNAHA